jgi:putative ABC transport system permease protein
MAGATYRRLLRLRFTRPRDEDVDEEFEFHLSMRARKLESQGLSPDRARAEALRQFGDVDDARSFCRAEDTRRMRDYRSNLLLGNLVQDLLVEARSLRRRPAFAFSTILTLGVAIAVAATAYGLVHAYLVRPLPYPEPDRLVQVLAGPTRERFPNPPSLARVDWRRVDSVFAETVAWDLDGYTLAGGERPEYVDGAWVSAGYFRALGLSPAMGRGFRPEEYGAGSRVAIISHSLWKERFARDPSIIGRAIRAYSTDRPMDAELITIVGVMPADAWHITRFTELLRPLSVSRFPSLARLRPGMTTTEAQARLNAVIIPQVGPVDSTWHMSLVSLQDEYTYQMRPTLIALLGGSLLLLLIGGTSVAGAQTARAASRRSEIQVRMLLGASRRRVLTQLLTENLAISIAAAVLGALLAGVALGAVGAIAGEQLGAGVPGGADQLSPGVAMLTVVAGLGALVGTIFGLVPSLSALRSAGSTGASRGVVRSAASPALRRGIIVAQIALTMMLLVGAGLMTRTIVAIGSEPIGFEPRNIVKGDLLLPLGHYPDASARRRGARELLEGLGSAPDVRGAAIASPYPFRGTANYSPVTPLGRRAAGDLGPRAAQYIVSDGYFDLLGIQLVQGRFFGPSDDDLSTPATIVSRSLALELWPREEAIGRQLRMGEDTTWRTVVGVVSDTRESIESDQGPEVYLPFTQSPRAFIAVLTRVAGDGVAAGPGLQRQVGAINDVLALANVEPLGDVIGRDSRRQRTLAAVLTVLGALALGIAMLGLYASLTYIVAQRRREIAIRVAVGASPRGIRALVFREGALLVIVGIAMGSVAAIAFTRLLSTQLYGTQPTDPATFAGIAAVLALAALTASVSPARGAAQVDPAQTLRSE